MPAGQFAAQSVRFPDGRIGMVTKDLEKLSRVTLLHQELNRQLTFGPPLIGRAADQRYGCVTKPGKFGADEDSRAPKVSAQDQDKVGSLRWLGIHQEAAQEGESCLPANGQDRQQGQHSRQDQQEHVTNGERKRAAAQSTSTPLIPLVISSLPLSGERVKMRRSPRIKRTVGRYAGLARRQRGMPDRATQGVCMFRKKIVVSALLAMALIGCNRSPASYVAKGNQYFAQGKYDDALLQYRNAIQKDPRSADAYYRIGLLELRQMHFSAGYDSLKHAVELNPEFRLASIQFGDLGWFIYKAQRNPTPGIYNDLSRLSQRLLAGNPKDFDGLRFKAYIAIADKRVDDALGLLQAANSVHRLRSEVIMPTVELLVEKGQPAEAEGLLRQLIEKQPAYVPAYDALYELYMQEKRVQDAEAVLRLRVEKNQKDTFALVRLADFYAGQQNTAALNATLQRLRDGRASIQGARVGVGDFYSTHKLYAEAVREYQQAIQEDPKNEIAYRKRIERALAAQRKNDEAEAEVEKILKRDPKDAEALLLKANFDLETGQKGKISDALNIYKDLATERPDDSSIRFYYARALLVEGNSQAARAQLTAAIQKRPSSIAPKLALADLALKEGKDAEALKLAADVLAQDPNNRRAMLSRATAEEGLGQAQSARADLNQVLRDQPDNEDAQLQLALLDVASRLYQAAASVFAKYYHVGQKDLRPLEGLVRCEVNQGQLDKALALLDEEVKKSPRSAPVRLMLANTAIRARKPELAVEQYRSLAAQGQDSSSSELQWAEVLDVSRNVQGAIEHYRKAVNLNPKNSIAATLLGRSLENTGQEREAIASYRTAIKADPNNVLALNNLAYALAQTGQDLDEALRMALKAQKLNGENSDIADTVGWIYLKKGLASSALQVFANNVRKYPKSPSFHYHLGAALLATGDKAKAKEELRKALENTPPSSEEPNIRQLLAKIG
jgi:tetratricopeptide (TPR) repeat protein